MEKNYFYIMEGENEYSSSNNFNSRICFNSNSSNNIYEQEKIKMKNNLELIEPLIYKYTSSKTGNIRYRVKTNRYGINVNRSFCTLEEARNFRMYFTDCISKAKLQNLQSVKEFNQENVHLEYPETLLVQLNITAEEYENFYTEIIPNFETNFEKASVVLSPKEKTILLDYYQKLLTLNEIGKNWGLTRERIRIIIARALRKLSHVSVRRIFIQGIDKFNIISVEEKEKIIQEFKESMSVNAFEEWIKNQDQETIKKILDFTTAEFNKFKPSVKEIPIADLDFSVRTYNCLNRCKIKTLGDLLSKSDEQLEKIRNLGKKSLKEIKEKTSYYKEAIENEKN